MASKLKIDGGKIKDGGRQVGLIKNGTVYRGTVASSSYLLAMTKMILSIIEVQLAHLIALAW